MFFQLTITTLKSPITSETKVVYEALPAPNNFANLKAGFGVQIPGLMYNSIFPHSDTSIADGLVLCLVGLFLRALPILTSISLIEKYIV